MALQADAAAGTWRAIEGHRRPPASDAALRPKLQLQKSELVNFNVTCAERSAVLELNVACDAAGCTLAMGFARVPHES
jgi:hypothetical protein